MKTFPHFATYAAIAAGAVLLISPVHGAGKPNFTRFRGTYKGDLSIVFQGYSFPGTAKIRFKVPESGRTGKVYINGKVSVDDTVVPVQMLVALKQNGKLRVRRIDLGNEASTPAAKGKYKKSSPTGLEGTARTSLAGEELGFDCAIKLKGNRSSRTLLGDFGMTFGGDHIATVSLQANAVGRK